MSLTVLCILLTTCCKHLHCAVTDEDVETNEKYQQFMENSKAQGLELFSGLDKVLAFFRYNESSPLANKILETFNTECLYMEDPGLPDDRRRKPFIVIEGNHRPSREVVGMRLTKLLSARFLVHPAPCLAKYLDVLPKGTLFRRAFYILSLYAQAFNVRVHLSLGRTAIINGYWLDQLVFHLIQSFPTGPLPPASSDFFKFPPDLLKPDVIYYLNIPDTLKFPGMTTRSPLNWKPRALQVYTDLTGRFPIVKQTLTGIYRVTTEAIYQHIHEHLATTRDVWPFRHNIELDYDVGHSHSSYRTNGSNSKLHPHTHFTGYEGLGC